MGLLLWWSKKEEPLPNSKSKSSSQSNSDPNSGLNGAMEVRRPADATVFEFGSSSEVTISGYCPSPTSSSPAAGRSSPPVATPLSFGSFSYRSLSSLSSDSQKLASSLAFSSCGHASILGALLM